LTGKSSWKATYADPPIVLTSPFDDLFELLVARVTAETRPDFLLDGDRGGLQYGLSARNKTEGIN